VKKAPAKKVLAKKAPVKETKVPAKKVAASTPKVTTRPEPKPAFVKPPVPGKKAASKDGIIANKDFDLTFLRAQRTLLMDQRNRLMDQAERLDTEREKLIAEAGMGDDQFDEDGGEGDTMAVERERDRVLSDQARQTVEEIDAALKRIETGDYGYSIVSTRPIPRERLEVIPWATELVEERVGWIGRR
jgi:RNA polymerase-binding transcription factor DksA